MCCLNLPPFFFFLFWRKIYYKFMSKEKEENKWMSVRRLPMTPTIYMELAG